MKLGLQESLSQCLAPSSRHTRRRRYSSRKVCWRSSTSESKLTQSSIGAGSSQTRATGAISADTDALAKSVDEARPPGFVKNRDTPKSESDTAPEEAEVRAELGRIAQMPHSAEKVEQWKELDEHADGGHLPYPAEARVNLTRGVSLSFPGGRLPFLLSGHANLVTRPRDGNSYSHPQRRRRSEPLDDTES